MSAIKGCSSVCFLPWIGVSTMLKAEDKEHPRGQRRSKKRGIPTQKKEKEATEPNDIPENLQPSCLLH